MPLKVYPALPGLMFPILKSAAFNTLLTDAPNFYETALQQTVNPRWSWSMTYDMVRDVPGRTFGIGEFKTLWDFFLYHGGRAKQFLFFDPDDNFVGPGIFTSDDVPGYGMGEYGVGGYGGPGINALAQLQVVNDGAGNYYSPLQRTFGGLYFEDVTDLNTDIAAGGSALKVYVNGVLVGSTGYSGPTYTLAGPGLALPGSSFMGLYLAWSANPAATVSASFNFYFRVRFDSDSQDMEKFAQALWTIGGSESQKGAGEIRLIQARPLPL